MEVTKVAKEIEDKIKLLDKMKVEIKSRSEKKATTSANYDKQIAIVMMGLQAGKEFSLEGEKIQNPTATITEKLAKGICWKEKLEMDKAEGMYKSLLSNIEATKAQLNGWQSINRHLEES
jgi:hypothetical protein